MRPDGDNDADTAAIGWLLRLRDGAAADWEAFTVWLESAPDNNAAYERVALADQDVDLGSDRRATPTAANDDDPQRLTRWWLLAGLGVAAAAAITIIIAAPGPGVRPAPYEVVTAPGEKRVVTLNDGSAITVSGGTQLVLDRAAGRRAELRRGEALFKVRHDPASPFVVIVGTDKIVDLGTVFTVAHESGNLRVAVTEGSVRYNPEAENLLLIAGDSINRAQGGPIIRSSGDADALAEWRRGRLDFADASLRNVAARLSRNLGTPVSVDADIAGQSFSGTIVLGKPAPTLARVADLAGVAVRHDGNGWRFYTRDLGAN